MLFTAIGIKLVFSISVVNLIHQVQTAYDNRLVTASRSQYAVEGILQDRPLKKNHFLIYILRQSTPLPYLTILFLSLQNLFFPSYRSSIYIVCIS